MGHLYPAEADAEAKTEALYVFSPTAIVFAGPPLRCGMRLAFPAIPLGGGVFGAARRPFNEGGFVRVRFGN